MGNVIVFARHLQSGLGSPQDKTANASPKETSAFVPNRAKNMESEQMPQSQAIEGGVMDIIHNFYRQHFDKLLLSGRPRPLSRMEMELIDIELNNIKKISARCRSPEDDDVLRQLGERMLYLERLAQWSGDAPS